MKSLTCAEVFQSKDRVLRLIGEVFLIFLLSLLVSISAQIKVILPFTPVPITFQTFVVLMISMILGRYRSAIVMITYILKGIIGIPVFCSGLGLTYILGPTGGYIVGFLVSSYIVGWLSEIGYSKSFYKTVVAMLIGNSIIYLFGVLWLSGFIGGIKEAIILGVVPFVFGDIAKILFASFLLLQGWKFIKK